MRLEERAEEKRKEIIELVENIIQNYISSNKEKLTNSEIEETSAKIIENFTNITPPEIDENEKYYFITTRPGGVGGGSSTKLGNIWLNWRCLLINGSESILTIAGAVAIPWLVPFAGLVLWNKIWSVLNIQITERPAAVIWAMWINRDKENCIKDEVIIDLVNTEFSKYNLTKMNQEELNITLRDLERMECIEKTERNKWWLREWVKVVYR